MLEDASADSPRGASPAARGGAGIYVEGELGAYYLLAMLAGGEARGLPGARIDKVQFQGVDAGYALDDLIVHGTAPDGAAILEIQSKRTIKFSPKDSAFEEVAAQVAKVTSKDGIDQARHLLAVATQRTSFKISGPYQDALLWARSAESGEAFFNRLTLDGVASDDIRGFVASFRTHLVAHHVSDDDETIWTLLRKFQILEFDFEAVASFVRAHALQIARYVLASTDSGRAGALWSSLIDIALTEAKTGGSIDIGALRAKLADRGFNLAGDRDFAAARAKLAEMASFALADIGTAIAGLALPRHAALAAIDVARDTHRFVQISGGPGAGKSAILRLIAERTGREARIIVLNPARTPPGGWSNLAQWIGASATAREFLSELAANGGATLFIDGLDMFTDVAGQATVNDLLREASAIAGFAVVATARSDFGSDGRSWLDAQALAAFGPAATITVGDFDDTEVAALSAHAPELRALLAPGHPAAQIARNPYRLSRLLRAGASADLRTEADLAEHWWSSGDGAAAADVRAALRLFAALSDAALTGRDHIDVDTDSGARTHLLRTLSLREIRRDRITFYHDVLRDWAVGMRLVEEPTLLDPLDLSRPIAPSLARGIEFAARFALEQAESADDWLALLDRLSPAHAHSSWRRHGLLAILRSEMSRQLLDRHAAILIGGDGRLLHELTNAVTAVDTVAAGKLLAAAAKDGVALPVAVPENLRAPTAPTVMRLLAWSVRNADFLSISCIPAVIKLVELNALLLAHTPHVGAPVAKMLFGWLMQLDVRSEPLTMPREDDANGLDHAGKRRLVEDLRPMCLILAGLVPEETKTYIDAIAKEGPSYKVNEIRKLSKNAASVAPQALANLILASLIEDPTARDSWEAPKMRPLSHTDSDYLPPSPAQPPFSDLLDMAPPIGLELVRDLVGAAIAARNRLDAEADDEPDGFTLIFDTGPRFFPATQSYFWSRGQSHSSSVTSALMALESWGHKRLDSGDPVDDVIADILGPEGSAAAYLLIAVDLLLSHWPKTRDALVPFVSSPDLLSNERSRQVLDGLDIGALAFRDEPQGSVQVAQLKARPSRRYHLEDILPEYRESDAAGDAVRERMRQAREAIGDYEDSDSFGDPAFMSAYALNLLDAANWSETADALIYHPPPREAQHCERLEAKRTALLRSADIEAKIQLATSDHTRGSAGLAREAAVYAAGALPGEGEGEDEAESYRPVSTRLVATAMLIARDGGDGLLVEHEPWIRQVVALALAEEGDRYRGSGDRLGFNRPAMGGATLVHLWRRNHEKADRDAIVGLAARPDSSAITAFAATMSEIMETDSRLLKSVLRIGLHGSTYRWHPWNEDEAVTAAYRSEKSERDRAAIRAEIAWLDGGDEPAWPVFPAEDLGVRNGGFRIPIPSRSPTTPAADGPDATDEAMWDAAMDVDIDEERAVVRANTQAAASWLKLLGGAPMAGIPWMAEFVHAYADWSARRNGLGHDARAELTNSPMEWNSRFYALAAPVMLTSSEPDFEEMLDAIERLPDRSFGDVAQALQHAADAWYFNDPSRLPERPALLRRRLALRTKALQRWSRNYNPGDLSIDHDTGGVVATVFLSNYLLLGGRATCYLPPALFDRVDPMLEAIAPLLTDGPTPFVATVTMNLLEVAPRARHVEFLVGAVEAWLDRLAAEPAMWIELGIGRRVVEWLDAAAIEDPALLTAGHPSRRRIDIMIGRLVALGIAEAHEFEQRVADIERSSEKS